MDTWVTFVSALAGALVGGIISWFSAKQTLKGTVEGAQKLWTEQREAQLTDYSKQKAEKELFENERKKKTAAILRDDMLLAFEISLSSDKHIRIPPMNNGDYKIDLRELLSSDDIVFINRFFVYLDSVISRHKVDGSEQRISDLYNHFYMLVFEESWNDKRVAAKNKSFNQVKEVLGSRFITVMKNLDKLALS